MPHGPRPGVYLRRALSGRPASRVRRPEGALRPRRAVEATVRADDTLTLATALTLSATIAGDAGDDLLTGNNDEAAAALGVPVGTVMSRLFRARGRVARQGGA